MSATTVMAVAAVFSAGVAMYSAANQPKTPNIPPPPPPASYYYYDEEGYPAGEQVWDPEKNAYIYKPPPLTEEQKEEKKKRQEIRKQMLDNISQTPEDRVKAYEEYAKAFSDAMHKDVDQRYQDVVRSTDESMEARGMTGSKAYADTISQLAQDKQAADVDIANKAVLAKEQLAQADKDYWLRTIAELDAGRRTDYLMQLQQQQAAAQAAAQGTAGLLANYNADSMNQFRKWEAQMEKNRYMTNTMLDTASGLAFLYGYYNKPTKT